MGFQLRRKGVLKFMLSIAVCGAFLISSPAFAGEFHAYPQAKFVILSDLHFYDPILGTSGKAFEKYVNEDRKLLIESRELLEIAVNEIAGFSADFVIVSGDLTKDGERHNHEIVAQKLKILKQSGKKVFVIPGNHDVWNGHSVRFVGERTETVPTVSAAEFSEIFQEMGYGDALERDPNSLSYLAEPVAGLWLLALDSAKWRENKLDEYPLVSGMIYPKTVEWVDSVLQRADEQGKAVIVTMHHGILEHYPFNLKFYSEYLIDNHETFKERLSNAGVKMVFTGHFHAQDITAQTIQSSGKTLYDIETGSLVTAPCPYRIIELTKDQKAVIRSRLIQAIPSHPTGFQEYAANYLYEGTIKLADAALKDLWVGDEDRQIINPLVSRAFSTHIKGDEKLEDFDLKYDNAGPWGQFIMFMRKKLLKAWYTDLPPADNNLTIDLQK